MMDVTAAAPIASAGLAVLDKIAVTLLVASLSVCVGTRLRCALAALARRVDEPKLLPYWVPYAGHAVNLALKTGWLEKVMMKHHREPGFKLLVCGRTVTVVTSPAHVESLSSQKESVSFREPSDLLARNIFGVAPVKGAPPSAWPFAGRGWMAAMDPEQAHSFCAAAIDRIQRATPDLVSFLSSPVDQQPWEKTCDEDPDLGSRGALVDLHALVRDFVGHALTTTLLGTSFANAYAVVLQDLWTLNSRLTPVALGIPRYVPVPGIVPPYRARRRLLEGLTIFHRAFRAVAAGADPGIDWRDLDDVSDAMRARATAWAAAGAAPEEAAKGDLAMLWSMATQTTHTVFWTLVHILDSDDAFDRAVEETRSCAHAVRPESQFQLLEPAQLRFDVEGLAKCGFLRAALCETVRLMSTEWIVGRARGQVDILGKKGETRLRVEEGEYVVAFVKTGSAAEDEDCGAVEEFDAERVAKLATKGEPLGSRFRNGPLYDADATNELEERIVLAFVAGLLAMWDMEPAKGQALVPPAVYAPLVKVPQRDVRVHLMMTV